MRPQRQASGKFDPADTPLTPFGRVVVMALGAIAAVLGAVAATRVQYAIDDPFAYTAGAAALLAMACAYIAFLGFQRRMLSARIASLESDNDKLADDYWELREAEQRERSLLESQGDLILRRDMSGGITYANDAYCQLAGAARGELIGSAAHLPVTEQTAPTVQPDGTRVYDQKIVNGEKTHWIAWREVTVRSDTGAEIQFVGRDLTARIEAERAFTEARDAAQAANRAKSRFLATVSHEIRTPLNGILGMTDLLLDTKLSPEQVTYAKAARTSGETLLALIEDVLDFSKIEAGKITIEARPFSLGRLVEEIVELLAPRAQAKGIEIASFIDERLPDSVTGDSARIRQVLLNLAGNAVKFTERGGVAIIAEPGKDTDSICFAIRDTGIGLNADDLGRIFLEFEQVDNSSTRKTGGTGLGLAVSKRLIERMDGAIEVDSAAGAGSTFSVTLPLPASADAKPLDFEPPDLTGMSVMIAATAQIEASLLARRLARWGATVSLASDADMAAALLPEREWHSLLVDHSLATALAPAISAGGSAQAMRRIVLITPGQRNDLAALREAGFNGYLVKPVRAVSLAARLRPEDAFDHAPAEVAAEESAAAPKRAATETGLSILVAEDNDVNALLTRALLTKLGHRPVLASDGAATVESWLAARAAGDDYDLILMDVHMPVADGLTATRQIRAAEPPDGPRTPIVALTANAYSGDREACLAAGMDDILVKPLDRDRLANALAAIPRRKRTQAAA